MISSSYIFLSGYFYVQSGKAHHFVKNAGINTMGAVILDSANDS